MTDPVSVDPVNELDHLGWEPGLDQDLHQHGRRVRDVLGGLENDRVAADERGK